ncbi:MULTISPECIES: hypothetical protein [Acinetobacter]|jgi:hypothetical protein|uniref:hypothetical protein n=1 Tax=Acinetobacter TaxID=469 RepID=UPI001900C7E4|nr:MULTISPECIES: hypothetical protein [Acinetobacter]MBJ8501832.1 hypothetical protein [Acinetobacter pittii]MBJ9892265.1 hypothetical protein [Acinetobacter pittii]MCU4377311.1 hypothetical protein [Acinetobacter haemolyticus]MCU4480020.1 hypothetical protein [Acinetobacter sp. WU_MDCI_Abxd143]MDW8487661.1 hypothetical protein [Acinetobacter sp. OYA S30]
MNRNSTDSSLTKTLQPMHWVLIVCGMIVLLTVAVLYNQQQQRQTDLKLAQLAATQSQASHSSTATTTEPSTSADLDMGEDGISMSTDFVEAESSTSTGNAERQQLSMQVDGEYHEDQTLSSNPSTYGLKPIQAASADLKSMLPEIDQMLRSHLMEEWGRADRDQVQKRVEGWNQQGNELTYRAAWDSDRYQCTWYVVRWNLTSQQVLQEGYQPCF